MFTGHRCFLEVAGIAVVGAGKFNGAVPATRFLTLDYVNPCSFFGKTGRSCAGRYIFKIKAEKGIAITTRAIGYG